MQKNTVSLVVILVSAVIAAGCGSSSNKPGGSAGNSAAGSGGAGSGSSGKGGVGGGTSEVGITCLGSEMCDTGQICCGNMATMSTGCVTGTACPAAQTHLCKTATECAGGAACTHLTIMSVMLGVCGLSSGTAGAGDGADAG